MPVLSSAFARFRLPCSTLLLCSLAVPADPSYSAQLQVEPLLVEVNAPAAAATLTLRNTDDVEVTVQTRIQRWSQADGKESLSPTTDVVASPPSVTLAPNTDYTVRIVRVVKTPSQGEETYRAIIDQLPNPRRAPGQAVNLLIRQSIPVFFRGRALSVANVGWKVLVKDGKPTILGVNSGDERLRIASLRLKDAAGRSFFFGKGLLGYVLGRSTMSWTLPGAGAGFPGKGPISVLAETDKGQLDAVAR